ncbi:Queuine tRNA-ribosyltransferase catalytic subunit 1 [Gracilariopsis chorda]|uniref:Queuine tRNA-ribosyltransferase catalytic subunit 1 n=1 Tax=Gracilariopsis chorda TaxID=448386 RepID=A0A2V3J5Z3_9FLOR|nr:Queuine tRNA-ribosyltransferase catalytic subunit 1 [Gracilariopsis chorda]|eukprot:PXF49846.1 Queuine tRNA-ribosyltransferase catalytic subunit 1 [Gracilariopsis chorda]
MPPQLPRLHDDAAAAIAKEEDGAARTPLHYGGPRSPALRMELHAVCNKARAGTLHLPHHSALTPMFMPVGTQASIKGLASFQLLEPSVDAQLILANTYHLALRPGGSVVRHHGGVHNFMNWPRAVLTDSGGFQMVSLLRFSTVTERGVHFQSPVDGTEMLLTPEKSIAIQNDIGADIIMALDDVVPATTTGPRVEEACHRTLRWIDRCDAAHARKNEQSLFGIVQGGLDSRLRHICCKGLIEKDLPGYAIGGLSGGEAKELFWTIVNQCTDVLPQNKPRYCMGVGYPEDLVVCVALGADMFDCVYPARTARFGTALVPSGLLKIRHASMAMDKRPIQHDCACHTCRNYCRAYLHLLTTKDGTVGAQLLTLHNIAYLTQLMKRTRQAIIDGSFEHFVQKFMLDLYPDKKYPKWSKDALTSAGVRLL